MKKGERKLVGNEVNAEKRRDNWEWREVPMLPNSTLIIKKKIISLLLI